MIWAILTGEYPPKPGGVADYTAQLAAALAAAGDSVHVWFPALGEPPRQPPGVHLHPLAGRFGRAALTRLDADLARIPRPRRLLVQYVPHAFGWKAMNLQFCLWLYRRRRRERIWAMFHEVAYPLGNGQPIRHNFLGLVTRLMAALVARSAERCFVSIPAWIPLLVRLRGRRGGIDWLPVPSNLPTTADPQAVAAVRRRYAPEPGQLIIGHFGTYGGLISELLAEVMPRVLGPDVRRVGLLIGRGGKLARDRMAADHPDLQHRLFVTGELSREEVVAHIAACDLLLQPYPDGISSRRTSGMAGLALGVPTVTTIGQLSEPLWDKEGIVGLAPAGDPAAVAAVAERFLTDPAARRDVGRRGREAYVRRFQIERTVATLRASHETTQCKAHSR
jgi:glycosyltransferase involved in cell wall biosynthesis